MNKAHPHADRLDRGGLLGSPAPLRRLDAHLGRTDLKLCLARLGPAVAGDAEALKSERRRTGERSLDVLALLGHELAIQPRPDQKMRPPLLDICNSRLRL